MPDVDPLLFSIEFATRQFLHHKSWLKSEHAPRWLAEEILKQLKLSGYVITKQPPAPWHSTPGPTRNDKDNS
jgi:hypothetical protein